MKIITISVNGKKYRIKDCAGISSMKGLMFDNIDKYDGALIYGNAVWMPFVKRGLNVIFVDADRKIIKSELAVPIGLHPRTWRTYWDARASYCVELKDTKLKAKTGSKIKILK